MSPGRSELRGRERPLAIRAAFLAMAVVVVAVTVQQLVTGVRGGAGLPPTGALLAPLLLAASLVLQFFARTRGSPMRLWSLGLAMAALAALVLLGAGR